MSDFSHAPASTSKKCFNFDCAEPSTSRKGWKLRSGDFAELCDRCFSAYDEGRFCEAFHVSAPGWRCCDSCGKRVHCGCIVSIHDYSLLDGGGVECTACGSKITVLTSMPPLSPFSKHEPLSGKQKHISSKKLNPLAGLGSVPCKKAPLFSDSYFPHLKLFSEDDKPNGNDKLFACSQENGKIRALPERPINERVNPSLMEIFGNVNAGINTKQQPNTCLSISNNHSSFMEDSSTPLLSMPLLPKKCNNNFITEMNPSAHAQAPIGTPHADNCEKSHSLSWKLPKPSDKPPKASVNSNLLITPLFEKMLSVSDTGKIGRLVLPKKLAEACFPPISRPEGQPLHIQDSKGKEWIFQFRFWPNSNSRMYVLEGVSTCMQNMRLQAGDVVTFSRLEPEGKLVMDFKKASISQSSCQGNKVSKNGNGLPFLEHRKSKCVPKEHCESKYYLKKRKTSTLGSKSKRLRIENEDAMKLMLTWEEAQVLLRPSRDHVHNIVAIEGYEFEEYEDAPVVGRPVLFAADVAGKNTQWIQCDECSKWRKLPIDALLPSKWTCSNNSWDQERSLCSAAQEYSGAELNLLVQPKQLELDASDKMKATKRDPDGEGAQPWPNRAPSRENCCRGSSCRCTMCQVLVVVNKRPQIEAEAATKTMPEGLQENDVLPSSATAVVRPVAKTGNDEGGGGGGTVPEKLKSVAVPLKFKIDLNRKPKRDEEQPPLICPSRTTNFEEQ